MEGALGSKRLFQKRWANIQNRVESRTAASASSPGPDRPETARFCISWEPSEWHVSGGDGITPDGDNGVDCRSSRQPVTNG
jgi:hypothetical protein